MHSWSSLLVLYMFVGMVMIAGGAGESTAAVNNISFLICFQAEELQQLSLPSLQMQDQKIKLLQQLVSPYYMLHSSAEFKSLLRSVVPIPLARLSAGPFNWNDAQPKYHSAQPTQTTLWHRRRRGDSIVVFPRML